MKKVKAVLDKEAARIRRPDANPEAALAQQRQVDLIQQQIKPITAKLLNSN